MATVAFAAGGGEPLVLPAPHPERRYVHARQQAEGFSAGGRRYLYDAGWTRHTLTLAFSELDEAEMTALSAFHEARVAARDIFTFVDETEERRKVHFAAGPLEPVRRGPNDWRVEVTLQYDEMDT